MVRIRHRQGRHFMDDEGRMFWINGPEEFCYLSEQRQWRIGLSFEQVLEWKQCAPSGLVSQRFPSLLAACEAFEHNEVTWSHDLYLRRMGDQMQLHRSVPDYRPTSMKTAKDAKLRQQPQPWIGSAQAPPCCEWPSPRSERPELAHPRRRRRSGLKVPAH